MENLPVIVFIIVIAVVVIAIGWAIYQQVFRNPLGKGEEIYGVSSLPDSDKNLDVGL